MSGHTDHSASASSSMDRIAHLRQQIELQSKRQRVSSPRSAYDFGSHSPHASSSSPTAAGTYAHARERSAASSMMGDAFGGRHTTHAATSSRPRVSPTSPSSSPPLSYPPSGLASTESVHTMPSQNDGLSSRMVAPRAHESTASVLARLLSQGHGSQGQEVFNRLYANVRSRAGSTSTAASSTHAATLDDHRHASHALTAHATSLLRGSSGTTRTASASIVNPVSSASVASASGQFSGVHGFSFTGHSPASSALGVDGGAGHMRRLSASEQLLTSSSDAEHTSTSHEDHTLFASLDNPHGSMSMLG